MRKNGAMFICNRCRKQVFAERLDDGKYDSKPLSPTLRTAANTGKSGRTTTALKTTR